MKTRESDENPFLQGNFAPWRMEGDAADLEVIGELPRELNGTYYRNGPEPRLRAGRALSLVRRRRHDPRHPLRRRARVVPQPLGAERRARRGARRRPGDSSRPARHDGRPRCRASRTPATPTSSSTPASCWRWSRRRCRRGSTASTLETVGEYDFGGKLAGADDRAPEDGPGDRRDAVLRLLAVPAVPDSTTSPTERRARAQRADRRRLAVDDPRLRGHQGPRRLHPLPAGVQLREHEGSAAARSRGSRSAARGSASCRATAATPTCAGSTPTPATSSTP